MKTKLVKRTTETTVGEDGKETQRVVGNDINILDDNNNVIGSVNINQNGGNFWMNSTIDVLAIAEAINNILVPKK